MLGAEPQLITYLNGACLTPSHVALHAIQKSEAGEPDSSGPRFAPYSWWLGIKHLPVLGGKCTAGYTGNSIHENHSSISNHSNKPQS